MHLRSLPGLGRRSSKGDRKEAGGGKAAESAKRPMTFRQKVMHNWVLPLALVAAILMPIRSSIADWNDVPSGSMRPTILEGDRIYVNKLAYGLRVPFTTSWVTRWESPKRGDIVTLKSPADGIRLVKRVIGLPGDHIAMRGNQLIINGKPAGYSIVEKDVPTKLSDGRWISVTVQEEQIEREDGPSSAPTCTHALAVIPGAISPSTFKEMVVPAGQYFVMGDNRDMSRDSRMIGFVPLESIYGRCSYVALSVDPDDSYMPRFGRWFKGLR